MLDYNALQQPRTVCDVECCENRMRVYLLDGVLWNDLQRLRRWLHHLPDMHSVPDYNALQQPRSVCDVECWQDGMHVYLLAWVRWNDLQRL